MKYIMIIHGRCATNGQIANVKRGILDAYPDTCDTASFLLEHINTQYVKRSLKYTRDTASENPGIGKRFK